METRSQDPTAPGTPPPQRPGGGEGGGQGGVTDDQTPGQAFDAAQQSAAQLVEYIRYSISAKLDALKLSVRNAVIVALLGIVALIAFSALVITAVALLCIGIAQTISTIFHTGPWLGNLVTALLLLGGVAGAAWVATRRISARSRERTVKKYAARQQQQRAKFGEDVSSKRGPVD